jgi:hypothetical protein
MPATETLTIQDITEATPDADWTTTPDEIARGTTLSGARITIALSDDGWEYEIATNEPGVGESGGFDTIDELHGLICDVADGDTSPEDTLTARITYTPTTVSVSDDRGTIEGDHVVITYSDGRTLEGDIIPPEGSDPSAWLGELHHHVEDELVEALAGGAELVEIAA